MKYTVTLDNDAKDQISIDTIASMSPQDALVLGAVMGSLNKEICGKINANPRSYLWYALSTLIEVSENVDQNDPQFINSSLELMRVIRFDASDIIYQYLKDVDKLEEDTVIPEPEDNATDLLNSDESADLSNVQLEGESIVSAGVFDLSDDQLIDSDDQLTSEEMEEVLKDNCFTGTQGEQTVITDPAMPAALVPDGTIVPNQQLPEDEVNTKSADSNFNSESIDPIDTALANVADIGNAGAEAKEAEIKGFAD